MEIVAKLRETGTRIPKAIQEEISEFQAESGTNKSPTVALNGEQKW